MKVVSVIIINWNGKRFLKKCVDSVFEQTYSDIELIVVDNDSTDGSLEDLKESYPDAQYIENKDNLGFSKAVNQGIGAAKGSYLLPLNHDVVLTPTYIEEMVRAIEEDNRIGLVSGKLLQFDGQKCTNIIDSTGHLIFKNRLPLNRGVDEEDQGQYGDYEYIFGTSGAAPLYRKEMLEDVQLDGEIFDEDFFSFLEDVDLDWRAQLLGWKCMYTPQAVGYHYRGGPRARGVPIVEYHNYKNRYLMILKNDTFYGVLRNFHHIIFTDVIKSGAMAFRCPQALLAWPKVLKLMPTMLKKRRLVQKRRQVSAREIEKWFRPFSYRTWFRRHLLSA